MAPSSTPPPSSPSSSPPTSPSSGEPPGEPNDTLDLTGEVCPYTFVYARLRLEQMALGHTLHVLIDHEPATRNIPRSARAWGQRVGAVEAIAPGRWRIAITKCVE